MKSFEETKKVEKPFQLINPVHGHIVVEDEGSRTTNHSDFVSQSSASREYKTRNASSGLQETLLSAVAASKQEVDGNKLRKLFISGSSISLGQNKSPRSGFFSIYFGM